MQFENKQLLSQQQSIYKSHKVPSEYRDPVDQDLKYGPRIQRQCTDKFCCLLYIGISIVIAIVSLKAYEQGNIYKLYSPFDSAGIIIKNEYIFNIILIFLYKYK